MTPSLVSSRLCPYAQRAAIVLLCKQIEHDVRYIDLADPPDWFKSVSPLKKVPVLLVQDHAIFGSSVIGEFLEEAFPGSLHPKDALRRALNRSWIEFGGDCMSDTLEMALSGSNAGFREALNRLWEKFEQLERVLGEGPFFNGAEFSLVDAAYAPMFQRLKFLDELRPGIYDTEQHPRIMAWKDRLLAHDPVRSSAVPDLQRLFYDFLRKRGSYVSHFL